MSSRRNVRPGRSYVVSRCRPSRGLAQNRGSKTCRLKGPFAPVRARGTKALFDAVLPPVALHYISGSRLSLSRPMGRKRRRTADAGPPGRPPPPTTRPATGSVPQRTAAAAVVFGPAAASPSTSAATASAAGPASGAPAWRSFELAAGVQSRPPRPTAPLHSAPCARRDRPDHRCRQTSSIPSAALALLAHIPSL